MSKSAEFYKRLEIPAIDKVLKKHGYSDELRETYKKTHARRGTFQTAPENLDSMRLLYNTWITRTKLLSMLCEKGYDVNKFIHTIEKNPKFNDYHLITTLQRTNSKDNLEFVLHPKTQAMFELLVNEFGQEFQELSKTKASYLDVGCGDGRKTVELAQMLGLNKSQTFCIDVPSWGPYQTKDAIRDQINFTPYNPGTSFPVESASKDLITCMMVIHHVDNVYQFLNECSRVLRPGGFLLIQEHDAMTDYDVSLIQLEHTMYEFIVDRQTEQGYTPNYGRYYDRYEMESMLNFFDFDLIKFVYTNSTLNYSVKATRSYHALYRLRPK